MWKDKRPSHPAHLVLSFVSLSVSWAYWTQYFVHLNDTYKLIVEEKVEYSLILHEWSWSNCTKSGQIIVIDNNNWNEPYLYITFHKIMHQNSRFASDKFCNFPKPTIDIHIHFTLCLVSCTATLNLFFFMATQLFAVISIMQDQVQHYECLPGGQTVWQTALL